MSYPAASITDYPARTRKSHEEMVEMFVIIRLASLHVASSEDTVKRAYNDAIETLTLCGALQRRGALPEVRRL